MKTDKIDWLNRLGKWRVFFAGWQLGTRSKSDPECQAVSDHREVTLLLRAEQSALAGLLIKKGIFTVEEFTEQLHEEAEYLCNGYSKHWPGVTADDDGLHFDHRAAETMKNFLP